MGTPLSLAQHSLRDIKIPRWIGSQEQIPTEIHIFCDASEDGYGAAVYLLQKSTEFPPEAHLLCSKTRIAPSPKKSMTIPRLELISNLLAAQPKIHYEIDWGVLSHLCLDRLNDRAMVDQRRLRQMEDICQQSCHPNSKHIHSGQYQTS